MPAVLLQTGPRPRRRARKVAPARLPLGHGADYLLALRRLQRAFERAVLGVLLPVLPALLERARLSRPTGGDAPVRLDDAAEDLDALIAELRALAAVGGALFDRAVVETIANRLAVQVSGFQRRQLSRQAKRAIGVDVVAAEPWLAEHLRLFVSDNVALVKSIPAQQLDRLEALLHRAVRSDLRVEVLRDEIGRVFAKGRQRAELIARDQTLKLNGELNDLRMREIGVRQAHWSDSNDGRERKQHRRLGAANDGKGVLYDLDGSGPVVDPKSGKRAKPGEEVQCRCVGVPDFDALLGGGEG